MEKMIDTHIHLNDEQYDFDLAQVIQRSKDAGVEKEIVICCDIEGMRRGLEIKKEYGDYIAIVMGYHPVDVSKLPEDYLEILETNMTKTNVVAIGEIGLDYHWYPEEKEEQKKLFVELLEVAKKHDLPYVIHARESYDDCYEILKEFGYFNGVLHSFSDDYESAKRFLDLGLYIGITGPITFKNGQNQRDVVSNMDLDRLVIETDGPYLTPVPFRGKRNESKNLEYICEEISKLRGMSIDEVKKKTTENAYNLFGRLN